MTGTHMLYNYILRRLGLNSLLAHKGPADDGRRIACDDVLFYRWSVSDKGRRSGEREGWKISPDERVADDGKRISGDDVVFIE